MEKKIGGNQKKMLKLNKKLYNKEAVKEAINEFSRICEGRIVNDKIEVILKPKKKTEHLEEEFCNYVLGLMKNKTLV